MQSVDAKEEKQPSSNQSTPSGTPQSSPKQKRRCLNESAASHPLFCINHFVGCNFECVFGRGWFTSQGSTASLTGSEMSTSSSSSIDLASGDGHVERWGVFGPRPQVSKSTTDPGTDSAMTGKPHGALYMKRNLSAYSFNYQNHPHLHSNNPFESIRCAHVIIITVII